MTGEELKLIAVSLYGSRGWQKRLAETLKVNTSTIRRWVSGVVPVPGPAERAIRSLRPAKNN